MKSYYFSRNWKNYTTHTSFLKRVKSGSEEAWNEFFNKYSGMIWDIGKKRNLSPVESAASSSSKYQQKPSFHKNLPFFYQFVQRKNIFSLTNRHSRSNFIRHLILSFIFFGGIKKQRQDALLSNNSSHHKIRDINEE